MYGASTVSRYINTMMFLILLRKPNLYFLIIRISGLSLCKY